MACEYCDGSGGKVISRREFPSWHGKAPHAVSLFIDGDGVLVARHSQPKDFQFSAQAKIRFCPMCGRRLGTED